MSQTGDDSIFVSGGWKSEEGGSNDVSRFWLNPIPFMPYGYYGDYRMHDQHGTIPSQTKTIKCLRGSADRLKNPFMACSFCSGSSK